MANRLLVPSRSCSCHRDAVDSVRGGDESIRSTRTRRRACCYGRDEARAGASTARGHRRSAASIVTTSDGDGELEAAKASRSRHRRDGTITITGGDDSGALYGCLELARRIREPKQLPDGSELRRRPRRWSSAARASGCRRRTSCPAGRSTSTRTRPSRSRSSTTRQFWTEYLDFLAENRFNTLYLWNGHPFASLVKLKDYPYALEVPDDVVRAERRDVPLHHDRGGPARHLGRAEFY